MQMISLISILFIGIFNICESKEYCKQADRYCDEYCCVDYSNYYRCCSSCSQSIYTTNCPTVSNSPVMISSYLWIIGVVIAIIAGIVTIIILILCCCGCICKNRRSRRGVQQPTAIGDSSNVQNVQIYTVPATNPQHSYPQAPPVYNTVINNNQSGSLPYPAQPTPDCYVPPPPYNP